MLPDIAAFQRTVYEHYRQNGRVFPWRQTRDAYHILVSEFMLQQTGTARVLEKYGPFIAAFPDFASLAGASLRDVLQLWQGLGYNRRATALWKTAQAVMDSFGGELPSSCEALVKLPGVGPSTASAILAFAFNQPAVLIETNVRTVFIHFFFPNQEQVTDEQLRPLVEAAMDRANPREWYYALFDYGVMLKKTENLVSRSAHYRKQSRFEGSNRQVRGGILRLLLARGPLSEEAIAQALERDPALVRRSLAQLQEEGCVTVAGDRFGIA